MTTTACQGAVTPYCSFNLQPAGFADFPGQGSPDGAGTASCFTGRTFSHTKLATLLQELLSGQTLGIPTAVFCSMLLLQTPRLCWDPGLLCWNDDACSNSDSSGGQSHNTARAADCIGHTFTISIATSMPLSALTATLPAGPLAGQYAIQDGEYVVVTSHDKLCHAGSKVGKVTGFFKSLSCYTSSAMQAGLQRVSGCS